MKLFTLFFTVIIAGKVFSQFELIKEPLKVEARMILKDSTLSVSYKNIINSELLLWVGDWSIDKLESSFDYNYLARPIKSSILLFPADEKIPNFLNYFIVSDTNCRYYSNYKLLNPGDVFVVKIKCQDLLAYKRNKAVISAINYSVIDIKNLCMYMKRKSELPQRGACVYDGNLNFYNGVTLNFDNINWSFEKITQKQDSAIYGKKPSDLPIYPKDKINFPLLHIPQNNRTVLTQSVEEINLFQKNYLVLIKL